MPRRMTIVGQLGERSRVFHCERSRRSIRSHDAHSGCRVPTGRLVMAQEVLFRCTRDSRRRSTRKAIKQLRRCRREPPRDAPWHVALESDGAIQVFDIGSRRRTRGVRSDACPDAGRARVTLGERMVATVATGSKARKPRLSPDRRPCRAAVRWGSSCPVRRSGFARCRRCPVRWCRLDDPGLDISGNSVRRLSSSS